MRWYVLDSGAEKAAVLKWPARAGENKRCYVPIETLRVTIGNFVRRFVSFV